MTSSGRPSGTARTLLLVAAGVVAAQALTFVVLAVLEAAHVTAGRVGLGLSTTVFLGVVGLGLLWAAWRVTAGDAWARSPLVFAQLIVVGLAWNFRDDPAWITPLLAVPAAVALGCLLAPAVTRALSDESAV